MDLDYPNNVHPNYNYQILKPKSKETHSINMTFSFTLFSIYQALKDYLLPFELYQIKIGANYISGASTN